MSKSLVVFTVVLTLAVTSCESDADKMHRLNTAQMIACLAADNYKGLLVKMQDSAVVAFADTGGVQKVPSVHLSRKDSLARDSVGTLAVRASEDCQLATRDYNRFMDGR